MEYGDIPLHCWSLRKYSMLNFCPRGALLYYREARAGADENSADGESRYLHHLRRILSSGEYCRKVLRENMRKLFYRPLTDDADSAPPPELVDDALWHCCAGQWEKEWHNMLTGSCENDHRQVLLRELTAPNVSFAALHKEITETLRRRCDALEKGAWGTLQNIPFHRRRHIDCPLLVHINELACCCAPVCALEQSGEFWIVESSRPDDRVALLHKFYGSIQRGYAPEKVRSFHLDDNSGEFQEFGGMMDISAAIRHISADTLCWKELLTRKITVVPARQVNCPECRFLPFCRQKKL